MEKKTKKKKEGTGRYEKHDNICLIMNLNVLYCVPIECKCKKQLNVSIFMQFICLFSYNLWNGVGNTKTRKYWQVYARET